MSCIKMAYPLPFSTHSQARVHYIPFPRSLAYACLMVELMTMCSYHFTFSFRCYLKIRAIQKAEAKIELSAMVMASQMLSTCVYLSAHPSLMMCVKEGYSRNHCFLCRNLACNLLHTKRAELYIVQECSTKIIQLLWLIGSILRMRDVIYM